MQTLIHNYYMSMSPIFTQMERLYAEISTDYKPPKLVDEPLDISFKELCDILKENVPWYADYKFKEYKVAKYAVKHRDDTVVLCISGGKDSVAAAKTYMDLGYNVVLYHMRGINKVYADEYKAVIEVAKHLGLSYHIDEVALCGTQDFVEHPMKNMMIANGALHYAINNGLGINIAFGNFIESYLDDNDFNVCAGDCMDMWYAYERIVRRVIPDFSIRIPFRNNEESLDVIRRNPELLRYTVSCMSPYRFREHWKKRTENKYKIKLLPNRCGCCWKCAMEYIYFTDNGILEYNPEYYLHCIEILYATKAKESGIKDWSIIDIWDSYLFYSISDSKAWEILSNAIISNGKIKSIKQLIEG